MVVGTKELKERSLYIYLPSVDLARDWKARAEKAGQSISKFIIESVLDSLKHEDQEESGDLPKAELAKKLRETEEELKGVEQQCKMYKQLAEKLDTDLRYYRAQPFLEERYQGLRQYDKDLVSLFKRKVMVDSDRLLEELNIDPRRQTELVRAIRSQLESLEAYGLVQTTPRGWKWVG